jgi:HK97 family phage prohead protease
MPRNQLRRQTRQLNLAKFQTRDNGDGSLTFTGYASTFDEPYDMGFFVEVVRAGAFTKTLSETPDVRFLINHAGLPLARTKSGTLTLSQDNIGLKVSAQLDATDPDVLALVPKMARGDVDSMSFGFRIVRQDWSPDYSQCDLIELALDNGDVSVVTYPANPTTSATLRSLRSRMTLSPENIRSFYAELAEAEKRYGAVFSAANKDVLTALLSDLTDIGDAIGEMAADVSDAGDQLDTLLTGSGTDASDSGAGDSDESTADEDTSDQETDSARSTATPLALAIAQAQALRLHA